MPTIISHRYEVGDAVFFAGYTHHVRILQCPDCLGSQKWKVVTPVGDELEFSCPRCTGWQHDGRPLLAEYIPAIRPLTIGSVRIDTADEKTPITYMCRETGVGSGSVYEEGDLFESEAAATVKARLKCAAMDAQPQRVNAYNAATLAAASRFTNLHIEDAEKRRRKFQFQLEDAAKVVFDDSLSDEQVRSELKTILGVVE